MCVEAELDGGELHATHSTSLEFGENSALRVAYDDSEKELM